MVPSAFVMSMFSKYTMTNISQDSFERQSFQPHMHRTSIHATLTTLKPTHHV